MPKTPPANLVPKWIGLFTVATWLAGTAYAFWVLQLQYIRPFAAELPATEARFFEGKHVQAVLQQLQKQNPGAMIVHFWDPDCPCSRFSTPHVKTLIQLGDEFGLQSVVVLKQASPANSKNASQALQTQFGQQNVIFAAGAEWNSLPIPASPAAAVVSGSGQLTYVGPYSNDAYCSPDQQAFVETAIRQLGHGDSSIIATNLMATGCFCGWNNRPVTTVSTSPTNNQQGIVL